jgi:hypothetical protein
MSNQTKTSHPYTSPIHSNKAAKALIAAGLVSAVVIPSYLYYKGSAQKKWSANQKEIESVKKGIEDIQKAKELTLGDIKLIEDQISSPLPIEYNERQQMAMQPNPRRTGDPQYMRDYVEFQKFVAKFAPPAESQNDLIQNEQLIFSDPAVYNEKQDQFFVKFGSEFSRIINAQRMKKLIQKNNFQYIMVPNEYIFFIGDEFMNIADKIKPYTITPTTIFQEDEIKELANFVAEIGYADFVGQNILKSSNGQWAFIDTEDEAFNMKSCNDVILNLQNLRDYIGANHMSADVLKWLNQKISIKKATLANNIKSGTTESCGIKISKRTDLDDSDINMEAAKRYAGGLNSRKQTRRSFFGTDPFHQRTREEALQKLQTDLNGQEEKLGELQKKLNDLEKYDLQKSWYSKIKDSWSTFINKFWVKLPPWH